LVARGAELAAIDAAMGRTRAVLLAGPAGVGKTRLARAALASRGRRGRLRWLAASASARPIPLGAFAPVLGPPPIDPRGLPSILAHAYSALCAEQRLILGIDDAHLLDEVSATLLRQLAAEKVVSLIITVRSEATAPDAVTALWKDELVTRIDIEPMTPVRTGAVLDAVLGGAVASGTAARLHAATGGNLLWLRHLIGGERAAGRLARRDGMWAWSGRPELTPALIDLIDGHIGPVDQGVRPVVEALALSQPLPLPILRTVTDPARVDDAIDLALVQVTRDAHDQAEARLAHPLYGEVVRAGIGEHRARRRRGQIATALAALDSPDHVLRRAVLGLDSDLPPDVSLFTAAAHHASLRADTVLAIQLLTVACAHGADFDTHLVLAFALHWSIQSEQAEAAFAAAAARADTPAQRHRVATIRSANLAFGLGRLQDAYAVLREAADGDQFAEIGGVRACLAVSTNRLAEADAEARPVLDDAGASHRAVAYAAWAVILTDGLVGRAREIPALAQRGRAAALRSPDTAPMQVIYGYVEALGLWLAGDPDAIETSVEQLRRSGHGPIAEMVVPALDAVTALTRGSLRMGTRLLTEAHTEIAGHGWTIRTQSMLALGHAQAGEEIAARSALDRAESDRRPGMAFLGPLLVHTRAWVEAAGGAVSSAVASAGQAAELAADSGQWAVEVLARHSAVCFGDTSHATRLGELAQAVDGPRAALAARHALALAREDPQALLDVSHSFEDAGLLLPAADSAAQAARIHQLRHDHTSIAQATHRATALGATCSADTPALRAARTPSPLSERQREIATLAARLTNKQIADQLGVSVRTIEGHIYHACLRLNLPSRAALANHITHNR
jgi:DNA-binding CsgD family transcriptional regulator